MNATNTVFIVDDDADVRRALRASIATRGHAVRCFSSAEEFLAAYVPDRLGCLVLDLSMQGMTGLELQQALARRECELPIIFISGHARLEHGVCAMRAGAVDFLEKPYRTVDLLDRIDETLRAVAQRFEEQGVRERTREGYTRLSPREREVLRLLVDSVGSLSSKQIAKHMAISPRTVEHYRASLMSKMQAQSLTELVLRVTASLDDGEMASVPLAMEPISDYGLTARSAT